MLKIATIQTPCQTFDISNCGKSLLRGFYANERTRIFDSRILARHESGLNRLKMGLSLILAFCKILGISKIYKGKNYDF